MTKRLPHILVMDAIMAAEQVQEFVAGKTLDDYLAEKMLRSAVERQFLILGEALSVLRQTAPEVAATIETLPQAIGFRNVVVHGYASIDNPLVWTTAQTRVPALLGQLRAVLGRLRPDRESGR